MDSKKTTPILNYITPAGVEALKVELRALIQDERPKLVKVVEWAASNGDRSENADYQYGKKRLREIDRRSRFLTKRIEAAMVVNPDELSGEKIVFGATVRVMDEDENEKQYMIVGEDETLPEEGRISWRSPIASSLLGKKVGDQVKVKKPSGVEFIEILEIRFSSYSK